MAAKCGLPSKLVAGFRQSHEFLEANSERRLDPVDEKTDQMDLKLLACGNIAFPGPSDEPSFFCQGKLFMGRCDFSIGSEHV